MRKSNYFREFYYNIMHCQEQNTPRSENEVGLKRLIRSLTKISQVQTREIRQNMQKQKSAVNKNRVKYQVQKDKLLKQENILHLPNLLFTYKLFENKNKKIQSIKERMIQSKASSKQANYQYRKIQQKKEKIAKSQHRNQLRYQSTPMIEKEKSYDHTGKLKIQNPYQSVPQIQAQQNKSLMDKIKTTVNSSRRQIKNLYENHCKQLKSSSVRFKAFQQKKEERQSLRILKTEQSVKTEKCIEPLQTPLFRPTKSIILIQKPSNSFRKRSLIDFIKISSSRFDVETIATKLTKKQQEEIQSNQNMIKQIQSQIQINNKLKESIVFGHLKKLIYGDRKGRFIQDNTFRTRLKGECSQEYMKIVKEQETILQNFDGSYLNRRSLIEKFSNILGTLRTHNKLHESDIQQFSQ